MKPLDESYPEGLFVFSNITSFQLPVNEKIRSTDFIEFVIY